MTAIYQVSWHMLLSRQILIFCARFADIGTAANPRRGLDNA